MELTNMQRADVLTQALPYIKKYYNKIIVVKYGGNAMINEDLKEAVMGDIVLARCRNLDGDVGICCGYPNIHH